MIDIVFTIYFKTQEPLEIYVCSVDTPKSTIEEVRQALDGERLYNHSELDFNGFTYTKGE